MTAVSDLDAEILKVAGELPQIAEDNRRRLARSAVIMAAVLAACLGTAAVYACSSARTEKSVSEECRLAAVRDMRYPDRFLDPVALKLRERCALPQGASK